MKQLRFFAIAVAALVMISCDKNDEQATGVGDALVVSKLSGTSTVYGVSLYAYTYSEFSSVKAVSSLAADHTFNLKSNQGYKTSFYYETPDTEFSTTKPAASTFTFSAVFENGVTQDFQDVLSDKALLPAVIDTLGYDSVLHLLTINWSSVANADSYSVNILDGTRVVFGSPELVKTAKTYSLIASGSGWASGFTPVSGKTYTVRLHAFLYEPGGHGYDVQAISIVEKSVVWGN